ncbi:MAG: hypothetical protein AAGA96_20485 [Verrucomicrobiota bacterium]
MTSEEMAASLEALKKADSAFGVFFARGNKLIRNEFPYSDEKVIELCVILDDISSYFAQDDRFPDQLAFSYDGGSLIILFAGEYRLVVIHHESRRADTIVASARAFLRDYLAGKAINRLDASTRSPNNDAPKPSQTAKSVGHVPPTAPIRPVV